MSWSEKAHRRGFLGRMAAAAAAVGLPWTDLAATAATPQSGQDDWLNEVRGTNKCLFDFPNHKKGFPLAHILNYIDTFSSAYGQGDPPVGTVGTFYGMGAASSISLGFNDATWAKYQLGEYMGLNDANGTPYTRNVFNRPTADDGHLLAEVLQAPNFGLLRDYMSVIGIENLQQKGTKFILCNNALVGWAFELEARGKGTAADIDADLRANLLPGVTIVPAMVIAIAKAQEAGLSYNKQ